MTLTLFSVAILAIFAICAAIEIYRGARRGFLKSLVSLGTAIASAVIAVCLCPVLSEIIMEGVFSQIRRQSFYKSLVDGFESLDVLIEALAVAVVSTVLFVLLFCLIRLVIAITVHLVYRAHIKEDSSKPQYAARDGSWLERNSRRLGIITGALCAVVVTMALTSPVMGTLDVAREAIGIAEKANSNIWESYKIDTEEIDAIKKYSADLPGNIIYRCGGKMMYSAAASTTVAGERVYIFRELELLEKSVEDFRVLYPVLKDPTIATDEHIAAIDDLCENVEEMDACSVLVAEFLPVGANAWLEGKTVFKIKKPVLNDLVMPVFDEVLAVCADTELHNVKKNTVTLLRIYSVILTSGILDMEDGDYDTLIRHITNSDIVDLICEELDKNPYMSSVSRNVGNIAIGVLSKELVALSEDETAYDNFIKNMASAVTSVKERGYGTTEEMVDVLTDYTIRYTDELGISVPDSVAGFVSEKLLSGITSMDEYMAMDEIKKLIIGYAG